MYQVNHGLFRSKNARPLLMLLSAATAATVLVGSVLPVRAGGTTASNDSSHENSNSHRIVRDRSDREAPLLPRSSSAYRTRVYQTLYLNGSTGRPDPQSSSVSDSDTNSSGAGSSNTGSTGAGATSQ
jgi:hypothetical protein